MRTLGLGALRQKIVIFTLLSLVSGLSQAVVLVLISEVAVDGVEGKHSIHTFGHSFTPTDAIIVSFLALLVFTSTSIISTLLATSVSEEALTVTRTLIIRGFFRSNWSLQSTERLGHIQQLLTLNSVATANAVGNLSRGVQALLMVFGLLGAALGRSHCGDRRHRHRHCSVADAQAAQRAQQAGEQGALRGHESHGHRRDRVHPSEPGLPLVRRRDPGP